MPTVHIVLFTFHGPLQGNLILSHAKGAAGGRRFEQDTCIVKQFCRVVCCISWWDRVSAPAPLLYRQAAQSRSQEGSGLSLLQAMAGILSDVHCCRNVSKLAWCWRENNAFSPSVIVCLVTSMDSGAEMSLLRTAPWCEL